MHEVVDVQRNDDVAGTLIDCADDVVAFVAEPQVEQMLQIRLVAAKAMLGGISTECIQMVRAEADGDRDRQVSALSAAAILLGTKA
ncbi:MAG: hypothetical protein JO257_04165 [Deltaproteobacteria bacterium]|nr:hypothetical protein [Deltaproteobacteria bacterium]